jgi:23S rRNA (cytosine1962-C5)-methyltransferase
MSTVVVTRKGAERLRAGNPWVWAADIARASDDAADVVQVTDGGGRLLGTALWSPSAPICLRFLGAGELTLDEALLAERLAAALERRRRMFPGRDAFRQVHGEADLLPGLVVDRYGDIAVMQTATRAMDARKEMISTLLEARMVVCRDDGSARDLENLPREARILRGDGPTRISYDDAGSRVTVDVLSDGKTGGFLDQIENHARAAGYAFGDGLDAFTYHGGFALALARGGCRSVLAIDENPAAVERAQQNARDNQLSVEVRRDNAFDALRRLEGEGRRFDIVVVDPPALAKRKSAVAGATRGYKELTLRALRLCRQGGVVVTCSCSGRITPSLFGEIIEDAVRDVGRPVQLLERCGAGRDHPPLVAVPETEYLKTWFLRVL